MGWKGGDLGPFSPDRRPVVLANKGVYGKKLKMLIYA